MDATISSTISHHTCIRIDNKNCFNILTTHKIHSKFVYDCQLLYPTISTKPIFNHRAYLLQVNLVCNLHSKSDERSHQWLAWLSSNMYSPHCIEGTIIAMKPLVESSCKRLSCEWGVSGRLVEPKKPQWTIIHWYDHTPDLQKSKLSTPVT